MMRAVAMVRPLPERLPWTNAVVASAVAHVVLLLLLGRASPLGFTAPAPTAETELTELPSDALVGDTPLPGVPGPGAGASRLEGSEYEIGLDEEPTPSPPPPVAAADHEPRPTSPEAPRPPSPEPAPPPSPDGAEPTPPATTESSDDGAAPSTVASASPGDSPSRPGAEPRGRASAGGRFGAVGTAAAPRDLGYAFTRVIPPSSDSNPRWASLPVGSVGEMVLVFSVSAEGRVERFEVREEPAPPKALEELAERAFFMLRASVFALRPGEITAGLEVIRVRAQVSDVPVPDEAPEGPFNLHFSFADGHGVAGFTQVGGRRVELSVEVLDITPAP
jgi:outer membrane biosynthesis protein TonB